MKLSAVIIREDTWEATIFSTNQEREEDPAEIIGGVIFKETGFKLMYLKEVCEQDETLWLFGYIKNSQESHIKWPPLHFMGGMVPKELARILLKLI